LIPGRGMILVIYVVFLVQLPLVFVIAKLRPADRPADFRIISYVIKGIMLSGILSMPLLPMVMHPSRLIHAIPL
jgi:hypothetical protein